MRGALLRRGQQEEDVMASENEIEGTLTEGVGHVKDAVGCGVVVRWDRIVTLNQFSRLEH